MKYNKKKTVYEYSVNNHLTQTKETMYNSSNEVVAGKETRYSYDPNGNQYSAMSTILTGDTGDGEVTLELSEISDTTTSFSKDIDMTMSTFDVFNRLVKKSIIKEGKQIITEYAYNGDGLRTSKTVKSSDKNYTLHTTDYIYDGQYVVQESGTASATYVRGLNYIAKIGASNSIDYYMYNAHGDVTQVISGSGTIRNRYEYDAFGETILQIEEVSNSIRYAGEFLDESAGLYYLRARYYDPAVGRFISEDTYRGDAANPATLNLYTYCHNDPIQFIDPSGHSAFN